MISATYSPDDNKIRLRSTERFPKEVYDRLRGAGFIWAPKQDLFVAPMWTPERAELAEELAGEIGDEDTTLAERAEERADRFEGYSERRAAEADATHARVSAVMNGIPLGQPILVGHHSERRARRDAQRIEAGLRKAVHLWETADYWTRRADGALRAAKYKELPGVRLRRVKGLEADRRKFERQKADGEKFLRLWRRPELTDDQARAIANYDHVTCTFPKAQYPASTYEGTSSVWSGLDSGLIHAAEAAAISTPKHERAIDRAEQWIEHIDRRLAYERAMLGPNAPPPTPPKTRRTRHDTTASALAGAARRTLKAGIQTASVDQLFPTPPELARKMVEIADLAAFPAAHVLEPSAGTGRLIDAARKAGAGPVLAVEIDPTLASRLRDRGIDTYTIDFLELPPSPEFDLVLMNPPFRDGADVEHIRHAMKFLRPGGRLVAICANGPRQHEALRPIADRWIELPEGSFATESTNVRAALVVIDT